MLERKKGIDIVSEIGGIKTTEQAMELFAGKMDPENLEKIRRITNAEAILKIANSIVMCEPDAVFVNTGSEGDKEYIKKLSLEKGEEAELPMKDHTLHFDLKDEQGRIVDRTFYIANEGEKISSLANKKLRAEAMQEIRNIMVGIMRGKIMMVGFYMRGPLGAPVSNPAIEITSSAYVSHSAELLYRNIFSDFDKEAERLGHFFANIHSEGLNRP
ncbi:MAG: phosphoenolpyruvate carboxykinase, partial [Deltaproteobacteria bacterium]|nr:phosphoenolpyruvate carboxykinase [Deltaproteobacteria bacterium]